MCCILEQYHPGIYLNSVYVGKNFVIDVLRIIA